jgi:UDP-GlcNAc:undecaprenyl-phosphate/decaprenyl-phosphate GlcNAc-1-phosphate transferase
MKNIQIETIILLTLSLFIIFITNQFRHELSKIFNLIDNPDNIRKFHSKSVPLLGGIMIFSSFLLINLYSIFFKQIDNTYFIIFICSTCCLIIGLIDDIKNISYKYKFLYLIIIFYIFISLDKDLQINKIYFSTLDKEYYLDYLSTPFTILSLLLLTNAINLIDGLDGLCITISIIFITWIMITFDNTNLLYIVLFTSLVYIFHLNLKKNIFLGDSGSLFLGCLIGLSLIFNYNSDMSKNYFPAENIFILFMLPGLDMLRVFAKRIINKKNPFTPDRNHLHHLLIDKNFNRVKILIIFILLILSPILVNLYMNIKSIYIIVFYILFYFILIAKLKRYQT